MSINIWTDTPKKLLIAAKFTYTSFDTKRNIVLYM